MGVEAWGRVLASAGLSPAIARVLSLEQGQTEQLCEFNPREHTSCSSRARWRRQSAS